MKKVVAIMLMIFVFVANICTVQAAEVSGEEAIYDLEKGGTQQFALVDDNGDEMIIIVEELSGNERISAGNYKVTHTTSSWSAGFYVTISSNKITKAYSPFHSVESGSISSATLTLNSSTQATYSFKHKWGIITWNTGVVAKISNGDLVVSKK